MILLLQSYPGKKDSEAPVFQKLDFFQFYVLYDPNSFTDIFPDVRRIFLIPSTCVESAF